METTWHKFLLRPKGFYWENCDTNWVKCAFIIFIIVTLTKARDRQFRLGPTSQFETTKLPKFVSNWQMITNYKPDMP